MIWYSHFDATLPPLQLDTLPIEYVCLQRQICPALLRNSIAMLLNTLFRQVCVCVCICTCVCVLMEYIHMCCAAQVLQMSCIQFSHVTIPFVLYYVYCTCDAESSIRRQQAVVI